MINLVHPVGSIWETTTTDDPNVLWSGTTWVKMDAGRVLVSSGTYTENGTTYTYNLGDKGGEAKHQSTIEELVKHDHNISISTTKLDGYLSTANTPKQNGPSHRDGGGIVKLEDKFDAYLSFGDSDRNDFCGRNLHIEASHNHSATISTAGNSQPHENRMPYEVVHRWKRTA